MFKKIKIPFVTGAFEGAYTYKMHWQGAQHFFYGIDTPHKHLFVTPPGPCRAPASTSGTTRSSAGTTTGSRASTTASRTTRP